MEADKQSRTTAGAVLHGAFVYDLLVWLSMFGREREFRRRILQLARLKPGDSVLDAGCGTGTLAIAAKKSLGPGGRVCGVDASREMIARAESKARKAGVEIGFKNSPVELLPFPDGQFDVVFSTMMLHHLAPKGRRSCAAEIRRVLRPGGRVLAVDFAPPASRRKSILERFHRRHGHLKNDELQALFEEAGLTILDKGPMGIKDMYFILAGAE
ncbi:MAG: class I SAM-dependent methyltransferase [Elusimicrobia bacterium]|nr:class I SAM-dependent methyltransferase [Elusimicrobiota bacterium]MDE2312766.1 class I SAM-dependent methyltransferase [Elusimicrobiota bacterium]